MLLYLPRFTIKVDDEGGGLGGSERDWWERGNFELFLEFIEG